MRTTGNLGICIVLLTWAGSVAGDTHYVSSGQSIQAAIDAAESGDVVEVAPGTYTGPGRTDTVPALVDFKGKALHLRSSGGASTTTIDGTGYYHVVQCVCSAGAGTVLEGFTITGGNADDPGGLEPPVHSGGGGMRNVGSSPTVRDCVFQSNSAWAYGGGGMFNDGGSPTVSHCTFSNNSTQVGDGGGIRSVGGSPTLTHCTFRSNFGPFGGGGLRNEASATVTNCTFHGNGADHGGAIGNSGDLIVTNCVFGSNGATVSGGAIFNYAGSASVTNCTFVNNDSLGVAGMDGGGTATNCIFWSDGSTVARAQIGGSCVVTYSDIRDGFAGEGNIDADPLFVGGEDFHLQPGSPCIDAGTNSPAGGLPPTDLDGNSRPVDGNGDGTAVADIGAYEAPLVSLGQLVQDLLQDVLDLNLEPGVRTSLTAELNAALRIVSDGNARNDAGAIGALTGFVKTVAAYRGKKIGTADADALIATAQGIINLLSRR